MSYIINKTDGSVLTTILDGTTNTSTGLTLIGRNFTNYGDAQNENFVKLLENFADTVPPTQSTLALTPLTGTLWYDTGNKLLKVYNGANFSPVSQRIVANTSPTAISIGDQWYDSTNKQLFSWSGNAWQLVGPAYTESEGLSGTQVSLLNDNLAQPHTVVEEYANNQLISIASYDTFTLQYAYNGFTGITQGLNLANNLVVSDSLTVGRTTTLNDDTTINGQLYLNWLNGSTPQPGPALLPSTTNIYDIGSTSVTFRDLNLGRNLVLTNANIYYSNSALVLQNRAYQGNVDIYLNSTAGNINALHVSGTTGLISVYADPVNPNHIATKKYIDSAVTVLNNSIISNVAALNATINNDVATINANIGSAILSTNANLNFVHATIDSNVNALTTSVSAGFLAQTANAATQQTAINSINARLPFFANIDSQAFTGTPTAPTPTANDNSNKLATTAYVDSANGASTAILNASIDNERARALGAEGVLSSAISSETSRAETAEAALMSTIGGLGTMASQNSTAVNITGGSITGLSGLSVSGSITATGDIAGFQSSDRQFKENIRPIPDALAKAIYIGGKLFDWTDEFIASKGGEDGYLVRKSDFGVVAQDVLEVFPDGVRRRPDGTLAVDYEKMCALAFAALAELAVKFDTINK